MDATTGNQLIPLAPSDMKEIYGSRRRGQCLRPWLAVAPYFEVQKFWQGGRELSDGLSGRVIQRLGTRVRFPGRTHNTFGFLAQTDEQVDLGGWENLALVATVD